MKKGFLILGIVISCLVQAQQSNNNGDSTRVDISKTPFYYLLNTVVLPPDSCCTIQYNRNGQPITPNILFTRYVYSGKKKE